VSRRRYVFGDWELASSLCLDGLLPTATGSPTPCLEVAVRGSPPLEPAQRDWVHRWTNDAGVATLSLARRSDDFLLRFPGLADFEVDAGTRCIRTHHVDGTTETLRHLLVDQVLPRVLAHLGATVVHAGAVATEGGVIAFLGESGAGKSTLTASLREIGVRLVSDDGLVLERSEFAVLARATYPSLRLWPSSVEGVFDKPPDDAEMAHYSTKRRLLLHESGAAPTPPEPLAAIFVLDYPALPVGDEVHAARLSPREVCIALLKNSFQLDPTDTSRAGRLFAELSVIAELVPAYALSYPREFSRLPEVHETVVRLLTDE
jgi:hypothetical protein